MHRSSPAHPSRSSLRLAGECDGARPRWRQVLLAGFDQLWQPAEAAHIALVARRHALAPLAPQPQPPQPQPEEARPPFSLYNEEAFIQGEDPCFSRVQPERGAGGRLSEGWAARPTRRRARTRQPMERVQDSLSSRCAIVGRAIVGSAIVGSAGLLRP